MADQNNNNSKKNDKMHKFKYKMHAIIIAILLLNIVSLGFGIATEGEIYDNALDSIDVAVDRIVDPPEPYIPYTVANTTIDLNNPDDRVINDAAMDMLYVATNNMSALLEINKSSITGYIISNPEKVINKDDHSDKFNDVRGNTYTINKYNIYGADEENNIAKHIGRLYTIYNTTVGKLQNIEYWSYKDKTDNIKDLSEVESNAYMAYDNRGLKRSSLLDRDINLTNNKFTMQYAYGVEMPWCQSVSITDTVAYVDNKNSPTIDVAKTYLPIFYDHKSEWSKNKSKVNIYNITARGTDGKYEHDAEFWLAYDPDVEYRFDGGMSEYQIRDILNIKENKKSVVYNDTQYGYISNVKNTIMQFGPVILGLDNVIKDGTRHAATLTGAIGDNILVGYTSNIANASDSVYMVYTVRDSFGQPSPGHLSYFNLFLEGGKQKLYTAKNEVRMRNTSDTRLFVDGIRGNDATTGVNDETVKWGDEKSIELIEDKPTINQSLVGALIQQEHNNYQEFTVPNLERYAVGGITPDLFDECYSQLYDNNIVPKDGDNTGIKYKVNPNSKKNQSYIQYLKDHTELGAFATIIKLTEADLDKDLLGHKVVKEMPILNIKSVVAAVDDSGVSENFSKYAQSNLLQKLLSLRFHTNQSNTSITANGIINAFKNNNFIIMNFSNSDGTNRRSVIAYNIDVNNTNSEFPKYTLAYVDYASILFGLQGEGTHYIYFNEDNGSDIKVEPVESVLADYSGTERLDLISSVLVPNQTSYEEFSNLEYTNLGLRTKKKLNELDVKQIMLTDEYNWGMIDVYSINENTDEDGTVTKEVDTELGIKLRFTGTEDSIGKIEIIDTETSQPIDIATYKQELLSTTE